MVLPTVHEISHDRALELQREWQREVAEQAKLREFAALKSAAK